MRIWICWVCCINSFQIVTTEQSLESKSSSNMNNNDEIIGTWDYHRWLYVHIGLSKCLNEICLYYIWILTVRFAAFHRLSTPKYVCFARSLIHSTYKITHIRFSDEVKATHMHSEQMWWWALIAFEIWCEMVVGCYIISSPVACSFYSFVSCVQCIFMRIILFTFYSIFINNFNCVHVYGSTNTVSYVC